MPRPADLDPGAYEADGGRAGVLLIHGFTGSAAETRPMGQYLAARGMTVRCPLLPGHGTSPEDLTRIRWRDWAAAAEQALADLLRRCQVVFAGGLSLGALLALWLGANRREVAGLVLMAPAVKIQSRLLPLTLGLRYVMRYQPGRGPGDQDLGDSSGLQYIWCYDETPLWGAAEVFLLQRRVRMSLQRIRQPVLLFQGRRDAALAPDAAQIVYDGVGSADKTLVWLEGSGHNVLADGERESLWAQSHVWLARHASE